MKSAKSRILALLMALVMCLGFLPTSALAADAPGLVLGSRSGDDGYVTTITPDYKSIAFSISNTDVLEKTCTLTRVIQYLDGREERLTDEVYKNVKMNFASPNPRRGAEFGDWHYEDGSTFSGRISEDTTIYLTESYRDEICSVTYDANGGVMLARTDSLRCGETIELPRVSPPYGYTFLGWYSGTPENGVLNDYVKWDDGDIVTESMALYAMWEKPAAKTYTVTFDLNGAPGKIDPIIISDQTVLFQLDPEWEGYEFLGWYYMDGETKTDRPFTGKNFSTMTIFADTRLYAKWEKLQTCTVTFDIGIIGRDSPEPITVPYGEEPYGWPIPNDFIGHKFMGWALADGTLWVWRNSADSFETRGPITEDITLYGVWDPPFGTDDTFSFGNWSADEGKEQYFNPTYMISAPYLNFLLAGEDAQHQGWIRDHADNGWGGSCFGMSAVYALKYAGEIDPGVFQSGAELLQDLDWPSRSDGVNDLINFYHLAQLTQSVQNLYPNDGTPARSVNRGIVSAMQSTDQYAVLCFTFNSKDGRSGHAVVGKSITQDSNGNYLIDIWDNVRPEESVDGQLVISSDFQDAYFTSDIYQAAEYNRGLTLDYVASVESNTFSRKDLQGYIQGNRSYSAASSAQSSSILGIETNDFTVTSSDGRTAVVQNGQQVSGDLTLRYFPIYSGPAGSYNFILPSDIGDLTVTTDTTDTSVYMLTDDYYATIEADDLTSVRFTEGLVDSTTASASQQTITYTSDVLGDNWNQLIVSGTDTGFTLEAGKENVTISSDNNVRAQVSGMNVSDGKTSSAQAVSVTPAGVTVSTASGDLTAEETPAPAGENPFTDVAESAYYHDAVLWAVEKGITSGTSATTFSPNNPCTRAQAVTFLWRAAGSPEPGIAENPFVDVSADAYYYKAVLWAVEKGITSGTSATTFSPNATCSRAQIVTFLWRTYEN